MRLGRTFYRAWGMGMVWATSEIERQMHLLDLLGKRHQFLIAVDVFGDR